MVNCRFLQIWGSSQATAGGNCAPEWLSVSFPILSFLCPGTLLEAVEVRSWFPKIVLLGELYPADLYCCRR